MQLKPAIMVASSYFIIRCLEMKTSNKIIEILHMNIITIIFAKFSNILSSLFELSCFKLPGIITHCNIAVFKKIVDKFVWVLLDILDAYGAATSQVLAIYENFQDFAVSVLLLYNLLFLLAITYQKKGSVEAGLRSFYP
jgi:hypothetical protein